MNRRQFLLGGMPALRPPVRLPIQVMEVFHGRDGPSALLVHHADATARTVFAQWLRRHSGSRVTCTPASGSPVRGQIFRMKMCFGRGLILTDQPLELRVQDRMEMVELDG